MNLKKLTLTLKSGKWLKSLYTEEELTYRLNNGLPITKSELEEQESKNEYL